MQEEALSTRETTVGLPQPQCHAEPTEAKAARPPKGGSVFLRVGCGSGECIIVGHWGAKRWEAIGLCLAGALCCLPPMPTCGHRYTRQGGKEARRDSEAVGWEPWRWVLLCKRWPRGAQVGRKGLAAVCRWCVARGGHPCSTRPGRLVPCGLDARKPPRMRHNELHK